MSEHLAGARAILQAHQRPADGMLSATVYLTSQGVPLRQAQALLANGDDKKGRWVTIGAQESTGPNGNKKSSGGTPVFIDPDGTIKKGPSGMVGNPANKPRGESNGPRTEPRDGDGKPGPEKRDHPLSETDTHDLEAAVEKDLIRYFRRSTPEERERGIEIARKNLGRVLSALGPLAERDPTLFAKVRSWVGELRKGVGPSGLFTANGVMSLVAEAAYREGMISHTDRMTARSGPTGDGNLMMIDPVTRSPREINL